MVTTTNIEHFVPLKTLGDSFDSCIVEITKDKRVIYSANLIVNTLYDEIVQWNKEHLSNENPEEEDHLMLAIEHYYHTIECLTVNKGIEFTELDIMTL